ARCARTRPARAARAPCGAASGVSRAARRAPGRARPSRAPGGRGTGRASRRSAAGDSPRARAAPRPPRPGRRPSGRAVALLVLLARAAGARLVAPDLLDRRHRPLRTLRRLGLARVRGPRPRLLLAPGVG